MLSDDHVVRPQPVPGLEEIPIVFAAAGQSFTVAVALNGTVYGFGDNSCGQLGIGRPSLKRASTPEIGMVGSASAGGGAGAALTDVNTIVTGQNYAMALTKTGKVYVAGSRTCGRLLLSGGVHEGKHVWGWTRTKEPWSEVSGNVERREIFGYISWESEFGENSVTISFKISSFHNVSEHFRTTPLIANWFFFFFIFPFPRRRPADLPKAQEGASLPIRATSKKSLR